MFVPLFVRSVFPAAYSHHLPQNAAQMKKGFLFPTFVPKPPPKKRDTDKDANIISDLFKDNRFADDENGEEEEEDFYFSESDEEDEREKIMKLLRMK